jgi:hypothetical protein
MDQVASRFWPDVKTRKNSLFAIDEAFWVSIVVAGFTAAYAAIDAGRSGLSGRLGGGIASAVFLAGIALGIRKKSRIAASAAFLIYTLSHVYFSITTGLGNLVITALVALALLHGVRGTFAYAKLAPLPPGMPSVEQSFRAFGAGSRDLEQKLRDE